MTIKEIHDKISAMMSSDRLVVVELGGRNHHNGIYEENYSCYVYDSPYSPLYNVLRVNFAVSPEELIEKVKNELDARTGDSACRLAALRAEINKLEEGKL